MSPSIYRWETSNTSSLVFASYYFSKEISLSRRFIGAGSMTDSMKFGSSAPVLWSGAGYCAFATVLATPAELEVQFIDTNNEIVYSYALKNPHLPNGSIADEILIDGAWTASEVTYTVASIVFFMVIISSSLYFFWSAFGGNKSRDIKTKSGETLYDILGPFGEVEADNNKAPYLPSIP